MRKATGELMRIAVGVAIIAIACSGPARASDVDWKIYGAGSTSFGKPANCFYDANSVVKQPDTHLRVLTKCIAQEDPNSESNRKASESAKQKIANGYVPPIIVIGEVKFNQIAEVVAAEETANDSHTEPVARMLAELNCSEGMIRTLSIIIQRNGTFSSSRHPTDWDDIAPKTHAATLRKILCPR